MIRQQIIDVIKRLSQQDDNEQEQQLIDLELIPWVDFGSSITFEQQQQQEEIIIAGAAGDGDDENDTDELIFRFNRDETVALADCLSNKNRANKRLVVRSIDVSSCFYDSQSTLKFLESLLLLLPPVHRDAAAAAAPSSSEDDNSPEPKSRTSSSSLAKIILKDNRLQSIHAHVIGRALSSSENGGCCNYLKELVLTDNNLLEDGASEIALGLMSRTSSSNLEILDIGYNRIKDAGCCSIASAMRHDGCCLRNLQVLDLERNLIGEVGAKALAESLSSGNNCKSLQILRLSCNEIFDTGCEAIACGLRACPNLRELHLTQCGIGDTGLESLAAKNGLSYLEVLRLDVNSISDTGCHALIKHALAYNNTTLRELTLGDNHITSTGARELELMFFTNKNCTLENLQLLGNHSSIEWEQYERIRVLCHNNMHLNEMYHQHLLINDNNNNNHNHNSIPKSLWPYVLELLQRNPNYVFDIIRTNLEVLFL